MYDLHNVINLSVDVSHVLVLSYYLNNKICLKQISKKLFVWLYLKHQAHLANLA